jgi:hypothetical protein
MKRQNRPRAALFPPPRMSARAGKKADFVACLREQTARVSPGPATHTWCLGLHLERSHWKSWPPPAPAK